MGIASHGRFDEALVRARQRVAERYASALGRHVSAMLGHRASPESALVPEARFLADHGGRVAVILREDIGWVEAAGDYVRLHVGNHAHLLRETMNRMEERLGGAPFVRVHRSTIVNVGHVFELRPLANREYEVVLHDGAEVRVSRSYRQQLADALGVVL